MKRKKALVLDDDQINRTILKAVLEHVDYEVVDFSNPSEALELWEDGNRKERPGSFDLIVTDNQMPGMSGLEFLSRIRQKNCLLPDDRKAVISGTWSNSELERAQDLGCCVLHKPVCVDTIHAWVRQTTG